MASTVDICNKALGWLGSDRITSLDDPSVGAKLCKDNYAGLRDAVLEESDWSFAIKRVVLAPSAILPTFGYGNKMLLPADCLRVITCSDSANLDDENDLQWETEDGHVMCDVNILYVKYVSSVTDESKFSPTFVEALASRIAADLAIPLSKSRELMSDMWALYGRKVKASSSSNGMQGKNKRIKSDSFIKCR